MNRSIQNQVISGQMTWRLPGQSEALLHLRANSLDVWKPYYDCPDYVIPDPPFLSPGYATFVTLLKQDWEIIK